MESIEKLASQFIVDRSTAKYSPNTATAYKKFFSYALPRLKNKPLNYKTWSEFQAKKVYKKNSTYNQDIKCITAFVNWMQRHKYISPDENFTKELDKLPTEKRHDVPDRQTMRKIISQIENKVYTCHSKISEAEVKQEYLPALKLLFNTGIRSGAIESIRGVDIQANGSKPEFSFKNKGDKMNTRHSLPIPPQCVEDMQARMVRGNKSAFKFSSPVNYQATLNALLKEATRALGIPKVTTHYFRHSYATHLANETTAKIQDVSSLLCHKNISTTMTYVHEDMNHLSEVVQDNIGIEAPELMRPNQYRDSVIDRIVAIGVQRWRINCEGDKLVINLK